MVVWLVTGAVYLKALEMLVCFYHEDFSFFCGNFSLFGKRIRKEISPKNSLVSSFRDFFNLFFTLHVVLRNHGNSNCRDGCINLSNHLSGGDEILNAWETETVSSGTTVEY